MVESRSTQQSPAEASVSGRSIDEIQFHERRKALLARLIFASRSLAEAQFITRGGVQLCTDCDVWQSAHNRSHHPTCKTGRVLGILADLANLNPLSERSSARDDSFLAAAVEERPRGQLFEVTAADHLRASELVNLEHLSIGGLRGAYRELTATYYACERALAEGPRLSFIEDAVESVLLKFGFVPVGISVDDEFAGRVRTAISRELGSEGGE